MTETGIRIENLTRDFGPERAAAPSGASPSVGRAAG